MLTSGKWIEGLDADGSVEDAARRTLQVRLAAVARALPLAAHLADHDVEHVHRLRVATRRAIAALNLYQQWLPRKPARWLEKRLKGIRRAAGAARDLDVLGQRLAAEYGDLAGAAASIVADRRSRAQYDIVEIVERCRRQDRFVRKSGKLLAGVEPSRQGESPPATFRDWAALQLVTSAKSFFDASPNAAADLAALHQFRIQGKQLRYTIELLVSAFGPALRNEHYPIVEELQERLGKVQDHVTAIAHLNRWNDEPRYSPHRSALQNLAEQERQRLSEAVADFHGWWTDERADALRSGLLQLPQIDPVRSSTPAAHQT